MGVRNLIKQVIDDFRGLNTLEPKDNMPPNVWVESSNVVVSASGNPIALRSPYQLSTTTSVTTDTGTNSVLSIFNAQFPGTPTNLFDIATTSGTVNTYRFSTQATIPAIASLTTSGQAAGKRFDSVMANDFAYRTNGVVYQQYTDQSTLYQLGIAKPAAAPTVATTGGGTVILTTGVYASYAYWNSTTRDVGQCSSSSLRSTTTGAGIFTVSVIASSLTGIDGIVLFLSKDGGNLRYLVINSSTGQQITYANTTGTITFTSPWTLDTNTQETAYNSPPFYGGEDISLWQDRLYITGFGTSTSGGVSLYRSTIIYSGKEQVFLGTPYAAYPPLNLIQLPAKAQQSQCTVPTPVGLLCMGTLESYLLTGDPGDNIVSPQQVLSVTASLSALSWNLGTRFPNTPAVTPYGVIWLDQNRRIQLWDYTGFPKEIAIPIRPELDGIHVVDSHASQVKVAEGAWIDKGSTQYYVLRAYTNSALTTMKLYIVGFYRNSKTNELSIACAVSDIRATSMAVHEVSALAPRPRLLIGSVGMVQEIFDFDQQGNGWQPDQAIYCSIMTGNDVGDYSHFHSLRFDSPVDDIRARVMNTDDSQSETLGLWKGANDSSHQSIVDKYGVRHKLRFEWPTDDAARREFNNLRLNFSGKKRVI